MYFHDTSNCSETSQTEELIFPLLRRKPSPAKPRRRTGRTYQERIRHNFDLSTVPSTTDDEIKMMRDSTPQVSPAPGMGDSKENERPHEKKYKEERELAVTIVQKPTQRPFVVLCNSTNQLPAALVVEVQLEKGKKKLHPREQEVPDTGKENAGKEKPTKDKCKILCCSKQKMVREVHMLLQVASNLLADVYTEEGSEKPEHH
jgi:hypothetical protein